jgi:hypothetical protein
MRRTGISVCSSLLFMLVCTSVSGLAWAQQVVWNQEEVTQLATQMDDEFKKMRVAVRKEPHIIAAGNPTKQRTAKLYVEKLRVLNRAAEKLSRQLSEGQNREQTQGTARRIDSLLRDIRQQSVKLHSTGWTDQYLDPALGLASQLRAFYGVEIPVQDKDASEETVSE